MTKNQSGNDEQVSNFGDDRLVWPRLLAGLSIGWERIWPLTLPFLLVVAGFLILSWFDIWRLVYDPVRIVLVAIIGLAALASLGFLRRFKLPTREEIDFRIERRSELEHRPVTAQSDVLATGKFNNFSETLWREHRSRMGKKLDGLKSGTPNPVIGKSDPFALRAVVLLLLFISFGYASGERSTRITSAFLPQASTDELLARLDVWVSPPAYTNRPPLFLKRTAGKDAKQDADIFSAKVPEGSTLVMRVVSDQSLMLKYKTTEGENTISPVGEDEESSGKTPGATEFRQALARSGVVQLSAASGIVGSWDIEIIPDNDPIIAFTDEPRRGRGRMLDLAFEVKDDYGIVSATAEIRPLKKGDGNARPLVKAPDIALAIPRQSSKNGSIKVSRDLSQHPYAGGKVSITLVAKDGAGQFGKSAVKEFVLPARFFTKPLAAALVEQRRILAMDARNAPEVANMLDIIANTAPEDFIKDASIYTGLQVAWRTIARGRNDDELRDGLEQLWTLALAIEDGELSQAASQLREAQQALKEALENGASEEEISRLMKELRQAMNEYMRELTEQMARNQKNQGQQQQNQNVQTLRKQDLDRMMDQIENLAKSGSRDAAKQLLAEMQQMMDQLQAGIHRRERQQEGDQFNQQMNKLAEMMQQQQKLMDQTFQMQQQQQNRQNGQRRRNQQNRQNSQNQNRQDGQPRPGQQTPSGQMTAEEFAQAMKNLQQQQGALRDSLQKMMQDLQQMGIDPGRELGQAGESMAEARDSLGKGKNGQALGQQGEAMNSLRKGAQSMMQQMQQNMAGQRGGADQNGEQQNNQSNNDPLGRQQGSRGPNLNSRLRVPGEIDAKTARDILETIRRKLANPELPKIEFNYLDRLLKRQ